MNEISIVEIGNKLGISGLLTQQSINLIVDYGLNLIAGIATLTMGIWLSRKAGFATRNWLTKINRLDTTLVPLAGALVRYAGLTLTIVISLSTFGVETTSVIAVLGAAGIAIGLLPQL